MKLLLDTCVFLWLTSNVPALSETARRLIRDPANQVFLSAASTWEIAIKYSAQRLLLDVQPSVFVPAERAAHRVRELPVDEESALYAGQLPKHHSDPFDRMLVAQAIVHGMILISPDEMIQKYPARTLW